MLTELVIHRGMHKANHGHLIENTDGKEKAESLSKQEVKDILKFGAENLFRDDEEGQGKIYPDKHSFCYGSSTNSKEVIKPDEQHRSP